MTQKKKSAPETDRHSTLFPNNRIASIIEDGKNSEYVNNLSKKTLKRYGLEQGDNKKGIRGQLYSRNLETDSLHSLELYSQENTADLFADGNDTISLSSISSSVNEGNQLTSQQQEYFKDSKVRDEGGNLKVMYHGTSADFNIFDTSIGGGKNGTAEFDEGRNSADGKNSFLTGFLKLFRLILERAVWK